MGTLAVKRDSTLSIERGICKPLGFAGAFGSEELPEVEARIYVVASTIAGEVNLPLLKELSHHGPVAIDIQAFVRVREGQKLVSRLWADMAEGLAHVMHLETDRAEAETLVERQRADEPAGGQGTCTPSLASTWV